MKEMEALRDVPPVKIFTRKEIAEVAHLMTPPKVEKKQYLRADLY
jgi:hypothetical protein